MRRTEVEAVPTALVKPVCWGRALRQMTAAAKTDVSGSERGKGPESTGEEQLEKLF